MTRVTLLTKSDCGLCKEAADVIEQVRMTVPFEFEEVDITADGGLDAEYRERIPVVLVDGAEAFEYRVDEEELRRTVTAGEGDRETDTTMGSARK